MKFALCGILLLLFPSGAAASGTDLAVVMIDEKTEAALGDFPYDRATLAEGIDAIRIHGGKAVILKFFLDRPRSKAGDRALAEAMGKIPVVLQARFDKNEERSNPLPERYYWNEADVAPSLSGNEAWIPLPLFSEHAACIGFIDSLDPAPAMEFYRGKPVKSLFTCSLEQVAENRVPATMHSETLTIGHRQWPLTNEGNYHFIWPKRAGAFPTISLIDLLRGKIPDSTLAEKVVLFGYDGKKMHLVDSPIGKVKAHRLFYHTLSAILAGAGKTENEVTEHR